jgi:hypothetical protein
MKLHCTAIITAIAFGLFTGGTAQAATGRAFESLDQNKDGGLNQAELTRALQFVFARREHGPQRLLERE